MPKIGRAAAEGSIALGIFESSEDCAGFIPMQTVRSTKRTGMVSGVSARIAPEQSICADRYRSIPQSSQLGCDQFGYALTTQRAAERFINE